MSTGSGYNSGQQRPLEGTEDAALVLCGPRDGKESGSKKLMTVSPCRHVMENLRFPDGEMELQ